MPKEWYSVKGLFRWYMKKDGQTDQIEERVVLFLAESFDEAPDMAEAEAEFYCQPDEKANFNIEPVGWWRAYWIGETPGNGVEVFSRGAKIHLESKAFVQRYYPKSHNAGHLAFRSSKMLRQQGGSTPLTFNVEVWFREMN